MSGMNLGQFQAMMGGAQLPIPAIAQQVLDQLLQQLSRGGAWKQAAVNIINGITYSPERHRGGCFQGGEGAGEGERRRR